MIGWWFSEYRPLPISWGEHSQSHSAVAYNSNTGHTQITTEKQTNKQKLPYIHSAFISKFSHSFIHYHLSFMVYSMQHSGHSSLLCRLLYVSALYPVFLRPCDRDSVDLVLCCLSTLSLFNLGCLCFYKPLGLSRESK